MKISSKSRYGLKACQVMAENYEGAQPIGLSVISRQAGVTDAYLEQIMILLRRAGIVDSVRGVSGGYYLSRPPEEITGGEVMRALEDGLEIAKCIHTPCADGAHCKTRDIWYKIYRSINKVLDDMTLKDMLGQQEEKE